MVRAALQAAAAQRGSGGPAGMLAHQCHAHIAMSCATAARQDNDREEWQPQDRERLSARLAQPRFIAQHSYDFGTTTSTLIIVRGEPEHAAVGAVVGGCCGRSAGVHDIVALRRCLPACLLARRAAEQRQLVTPWRPTFTFNCKLPLLLSPSLPAAQAGPKMSVPAAAAARLFAGGRRLVLVARNEHPQVREAKIAQPAAWHAYCC